jgi:hypothetical protein
VSDWFLSALFKNESQYHPMAAASVVVVVVVVDITFFHLTTNFTQKVSPLPPVLGQLNPVHIFKSCLILSSISA